MVLKPALPIAKMPMTESLVIIGLWIIPKIQKTPAECGFSYFFNWANNYMISLNFYFCF
jgi:hypothetical protein